MEKIIDFKVGEQELVEGYGYVVLYRDWHDHSRKMTIAVFKKGELKYCDVRFVGENVTPTFDFTSGHHFILGVYKISDYREEGE